MISNWKQELVKRAGELIARGSKVPSVEDAQKMIDDLHRRSGSCRRSNGQIAQHLRCSPPGNSRSANGVRSPLAVQYHPIRGKKASPFNKILRY